MATEKQAKNTNRRNDTFSETLQESQDNQKKSEIVQQTKQILAQQQAKRKGSNTNPAPRK